MGIMNIIDHGEWVASEKPENYPIPLPSHILFSRRLSDGADWYQFRKELSETKGLFVIAVPTDDGGLSIATTTYDVSELFPTAGMRLFEVTDPPADHESLRMQRLDLKNKRIEPPPPPPPTLMQVLIEELGLDEAKLQAKLDSLTNNRSRRHG
jgi:hypothetical protein